MVGPNLTDEIDCGCFFDHFDDLVESSPVSDCGFGSCDFKDFPPIWPCPSDGLQESDPLFSGGHNNSTSDLSAELSVPYEDILQLEWLSTFVEDSFSGGGMTLGKEYSAVSKESNHNNFKISSPLSVLESSSSSSSSSSFSGEKTLPLTPGHRGPQRPRSKRPCSTTFTPRSAVQLISPSSSPIETPRTFVAPIASSESDNSAEFQPVKKIPKPAAAEHKKKKKIKLSPVAVPVENNQNSSSQAVRKCLHCAITKTPQWRAGPMGPKTLCNACGVRHKSGRLFPEYRPAASPTFVPSLHSNSHKIVVEMRNKAVISNAATIKPEIIPNCNPSLERV